MRCLTHPAYWATIKHFTVVSVLPKAVIDSNLAYTRRR